MKWNAIKKLGAVGAAFLLIWGVIFSYNRLTDGFSVGEMRSSLSYNPEFDVAPLSVEEKEHLAAVLDQKFRYLGKGCQFYAFESADKAYVLKFFKHKHLRPLTWQRSLPMPPSLREKSEAHIHRREERALRLLSSCKLAYERLPHETGVVYVHLNRTPALEKTVTLIDKVGLSHKVELDSFEFVLQRKAVGVPETFQTLLKIGDEEEIRAKLHQLTSLVTHRCELGVRDRDRSFAKNVAFSPTEDRAIVIDIGQLTLDPSIASPDAIHKDIHHRLSDLHYWSLHHLPELTPYVEEELKQTGGQMR